MIKQLFFTKQSPDIATPEDLTVLEDRIGFRFPPAFVEFCSRWNGGVPSKQSKFYPVPPAFKQFHQEYNGSGGVIIDVLFGATNNFPPFSLLKELAGMNQDGNLGIIPIMSDLMGNQAVLRMDSPMGLVYWRDHKRWEMPENPQAGPQIAERPHLIPIAQDLTSFYNGLTTDPEGRD